MKKMWSLVSFFALALALGLMSCSTSDQLTSAGDDAVSEEKINLEEEFGGYDASDEPAGFGDDSMLDEFPEDANAGDSFMDDPAVQDALTDQTTADSTIKTYFVRVTFGLLEGDSTATDVVDWSGAAEINKGTLVVLKKIRFEDNDALIRPRESRQKVEFIAQTKQHLDGLLLAIIDNDTTDTEGSFTFTAGDYTKTLTFPELDSLELLESVGANGHEVSIMARSKEIMPFAGGFLAGRWTKTNQHGGHFRGRWISSLGTNAGHLRGIWGINRAGNKVFKGKYISMNGAFRGLLAGEWNYERGENGGYFRGRWVNQNLDTVGKLHGKFKVGQPGDGRGFFHGRYRAATNADGTN